MVRFDGLLPVPGVSRGLLLPGCTVKNRFIHGAADSEPLTIALKICVLNVSQKLLKMSSQNHVKVYCKL